MIKRSDKLAQLQGKSTNQLTKPEMPKHNRVVIELNTPHVKLPGVQKFLKEDINLLLEKAKKYPPQSEGKFINIQKYKFKVDLWELDGKIATENPFKDMEDITKEYVKNKDQVKNDGKTSSKQSRPQSAMSAKIEIIKQNKEKRKKLEEDGPDYLKRPSTAKQSSQQKDQKKDNQEEIKEQQKDEEEKQDIPNDEYEEQIKNDNQDEEVNQDQNNEQNQDNIDNEQSVEQVEEDNANDQGDKLDENQQLENENNQQEVENQQNNENEEQDNNNQQDIQQDDNNENQDQQDKEQNKSFDQIDINKQDQDEQTDQSLNKSKGPYKSEMANLMESMLNEVSQVPMTNNKKKKK